ncbi:hypothetical protein [Bradyrhizobium sp. BRP56]|uniref:hypothetical protein n=1 Tax=Bradyrhizobium sp. BRP56 TaxID=2793819 RepID=UPI001CD444B6|nr:hypothetical protein [Bradyrhizobium sp. BRP56]MCA1399094.1 hypothetical protein [Bradyrhizobium sp. BRP56]
MVDANLSEGVMPWAAMRAAGYSRKFLLPAPMRLAHVSYSEPPEFLYVTGDRADSIHTFWFASDGGTGELSIVNGELAHVDCYGCSFTMSDNTLEFSPHNAGGIRSSLGSEREIPRNSEELLLASLTGLFPSGPMEQSK